MAFLNTCCCLLSVFFIGFICHNVQPANSQSSSETSNTTKNKGRTFRNNVLYNMPWFNPHQQQQLHQRHFQRTLQLNTEHVYDNAVAVSQLFAESLMNKLHHHDSQLQKLKHEIVKYEASHQYEDAIEKFEYSHRARIPDHEVGYYMQYSTKLKVNMNASTTEVPMDLYDYHRTVLNEMKWSKQLDEVFIQNYKEQPTLLWQYIGFITGASRMYPSSRKSTNREVDVYDCRRRLWYNQAINSPKDVVLALDMSGSMTGYHFTISKLITQSLIETLQQDDFFNVVWFNSKTNLLIPCIDHLAQATSYNKNAFKNKVTSLSDPTGIADFPTALKGAFKMLEKSSRSDITSSRCTKIIMIISDGIDSNDRIHDILAEYNGDKNVVIFSYKIGEGLNAEMKDIACNNGGSYYEFASVGNVLDGVLKYQQSLSKPLGKSKKDYVIFTPLYLDGSGLGMMTTISTAVFSNKTGELIGVAGMDIVVSLLQQQYPQQKMGVFGHAFAINNNGLFLMHPKFKDQSGYLPDPATVYLDEIEYTTDPYKAKELKKAMINGDTGCMEGIESDWLYPKNINRRVVRLNNTYCYQPMNNTPFFAGVSLPRRNIVQLLAVEEKALIYKQSGIDALLSNHPNQRTEIAKWLFCNIETEGEKQQPASIKYYPTAKDLHDYLQHANDTENDKNCDKQMLLTLLLSASIVANFTREIWNDTFFESNNDVLDTYVITAAGYMTLFSRDQNQSKPLNRDVFEEHRFSHPASFFDKENQDRLIFTVDLTNGKPEPTKPINDTEQFVAIARTIFSHSNDTIIGVSGATVSSKQLYDTLIRTSPDCAPCDSTSDESCDTLNPTSKNCYLVDENGYVVVSNQGNYQVSYFLGNFDGAIIEELQSKGIYERRVYNDTQADCHLHTSTVKDSAGTNLNTFIQNIFSIGHVIVSQMTSFIWWVVFNTVTFQPLDSFAQDLSKGKNVSCTKQIQIYLVANYSISYHGDISCDVNCKQTITIDSVPGTNLALITTQDNCTDSGASCPKMIKTNDPIKIEGKDICNRPKRYRKSLSVCYNLTGRNKECAFHNTESKPNIVIYIVVFLSLCFAMTVALVVSYYCRRYVRGNF